MEVSWGSRGQRGREEVTEGHKFRGCRWVGVWWEDSPTAAAARTLRTPPLQVRCPHACPRLQRPPRRGGLGGVGVGLGRCAGAPAQPPVRALPPAPLRREHSQACARPRGLAPESLPAGSSTPSASLHVSTLAPGAFPVLWVRNLLLRAPRPRPGTPRDEVGGAGDFTLPPAEARRSQHPQDGALSRGGGSQGAQRGASPYHPGGPTAPGTLAPESWVLHPAPRLGSRAVEPRVPESGVRSGAGAGLEPGAARSGGSR